MGRGKPSPATRARPNHRPAPAPGGATRGSGRREQADSAVRRYGKRRKKARGRKRAGRWCYGRGAPAGDGASAAVTGDVGGPGSGKPAAPAPDGVREEDSAGGSRWPAGGRRSGRGESVDLDRRPVVLRVPEILVHLLGQPAFGGRIEARSLGRQSRSLRAECGSGLVSGSGERGRHRGQSRNPIHARTARRTTCRPRKAKGIHRSMSVTER